MLNSWNKLFAVALISLAPLANADELVTPVMQQGSSNAGMETPRTGQTMSAVEQRYGSPSYVKGPVGDPPITVWEYGSYSVYFEGDRVIHTVLKPVKP
ncbi:hypothetical protein O5O45_05520 [Hahella aquimaris]|uniref:hypothetical protein n=1 Tax=Hahella sp. HNIBRBA332 TaxID=3015983 RepID=UPI00273B9944|nr:hypothetical protein [Hahella sp. HNIBRBA332]WLQ15378.1 hypothetical protein O5O45_05520 [Hahella sp. HNIBRBA332]